jgi:hypothetical protein
MPLYSQGNFPNTFPTPPAKKFYPPIFPIPPKNFPLPPNFFHNKFTLNFPTNSSIEDVIDFYKEGLHTPFHSLLPLHSYWLGDIGSSETSLVLAGAPPGTFLLRLSSQWGYLAASFMDSDGKVKHTLIEQVWKFLRNFAEFSGGGKWISVARGNQIFPRNG